MSKQKKAATPEASVAAKDTESRLNDTATVAFTQLMASNIGFRLDGDTLRASPRELLADELKALIKDHKPAIMAWLSEPRENWTVWEPDGTAFEYWVYPAESIVKLLGGRKPGSYAAPRIVPGLK